MTSLPRCRAAHLQYGDHGRHVENDPWLDKAKFLDALKKQFKSKYDKDASLEALNARAFEIGYGLV
jgi:hypothetical protein